ncbi:MAG TPA: sodium:solute symporter family protein [Vicinamibacterales bacterium]|nr:sodium:solute symporter family protein [Vicinamibacterales bacterium]
MIPAAVVFAYLAVVLCIGLFAGRSRGARADAEDYFLAGRSIGPAVFLLSLFGTNMTAFSILGASGHAFSNGIVTYGLMASSSALVIPLGIFLIGTRLWALGKRHGFMTPVQMFRDRWECGHIGTVIFAVQAVLLVPYIVIAVMGGGTTLRAVSNGLVPYWLGGAIVSLVVMGYVFFGGMRGTAWVNTFQTVLFLSFGTIAVAVIARGMGGFSNAMESLLASPSTAPLLTRERVSPLYFFSYTFIPLSSLAFPHIGIFCLTARRLSHFRKTVVLYPICMLAIWLPSVFLGVVANKAVDLPSIRTKVDARAELTAHGPALPPERRAELRTAASGDDVILKLVEGYAPLWLASLLGAAVMAAVMASDSQILALSTMFTEDVFAFYGGQARFGPAVQVQTGRAFVILLTVVAYAIALTAPQSIFDIASQYAFAGYSALSPLLVAALFWKKSTKWGALAVAIWTAAAVLAVAVFQSVVPAPGPGAGTTVLSLGGVDVLTRIAGGTTVLGLLPVVPMTIGSALLMFVVSSLTSGSRPSPATLIRYNV